jgi:Lysyl oxidase
MEHRLRMPALTCVAGAGILVLGCLLAFPAPPPATGQRPGQLLPDLGVAPLQHLTVARTAEGRTLLRFTTRIANVGRGPLEIAASRRSRGAPFVAHQRIQSTGGSSSLVRTPGVRMVFVGSPAHGHWHVRGAARYELSRLDDGEVVRIRLKRGFCFYDSDPYRLTLPGAPDRFVYPRSGCGARSALRLHMGLSIGWLDTYYWRIPGQAVDLTGLPDGRYRLAVKADPRNWFRETNERNNRSWVDLELRDGTVRVLRRSPRV